MPIACRPSIRCIGGGIATLTLALCIATLCSGCEREYDGKRLLLEWQDADAGITFRVTDHITIAKQNSRLHVERGARDRVVLIDDDAIFSTVGLVRYDHWLLVVCRGTNQVWAGYDYQTDRLYGEGNWASLPFTTWSGQGAVVAERKLGDSSVSPLGYPGSSR